MMKEECISGGDQKKIRRSGGKVNSGHMYFSEKDKLENNCMPLLYHILSACWHPRYHLLMFLPTDLPFFGYCF